MTKPYVAKDVEVFMGQIKHEEWCNTNKYNPYWKYVSKEDFDAFTSETKLYTHSYTIGDCIGYHVSNDPCSHMVAKVMLREKKYYALLNPYYKVMECNCEAEVEYVKVEGFADDNFIAIEE